MKKKWLAMWVAALVGVQVWGVPVVMDFTGVVTSVSSSDARFPVSEAFAAAAIGAPMTGRVYYDTNWEEWRVTPDWPFPNKGTGHNFQMHGPPRQPIPVRTNILSLKIELPTGPVVWLDELKSRLDLFNLVWVRDGEVDELMVAGEAVYPLGIHLVDERGTALSGEGLPEDLELANWTSGTFILGVSHFWSVHGVIQTVVVTVPDGGATVWLLFLGLVAIVVWRRREG